MNGAESLINTLLNNEVDVCFTNPGTSEMHFVAALDSVAGMRCVLCLFEGVISGAADGYARMTNKPAATLLHLGPGLANALANIHNAKKAQVPMLNIIGDHASYHNQFNAPLTSDIEAIAQPMSHWVRTVESKESIGDDTIQAITQARLGQIASLIVPADISWSADTQTTTILSGQPPRKPINADLVSKASTVLGSGEACMIMIGGTHISVERANLISRIGKATGARTAMVTLPKRVACGQGMAELERIPYLAEMAIESLASLKHLILLGCDEPVSFFAYPNVASKIAPEQCQILKLAGSAEDIDQTLQSLLVGVGAEDSTATVHQFAPPALPQGPLNAETLANAVAHLMPENAVVVDESISGGMFCYHFSQNTVAHEWLMQTGGSIGWGLPAAIGAAIACPSQKIICLEGDGSAMYTIQALWTMARENLDIAVVILANRRYAILEMEFARTGAEGAVPGPNAAKMLDISNPAISFVQLAQGMGVPASQAETAEEFNEQYAKALAHRGPYLVEAVMLD